MIENARFLDPQHIVIAATIDGVNMQFAAVPDNAEWIRLQKAGVKPAAYVAPVPQVVTRVQAMIALQRANLLDLIPVALETAGPEAKIYWDNAAVFRRDSDLISAIGAQLGLSSTDIDQLFYTAAGIS
jgi:hypothetical protein